MSSAVRICIIPWLLLSVLAATSVSSNEILPNQDSAGLSQDDESFVTLEIKYGGSREDREFEEIPWREGMTVFDVLVQARRVDREFAFRHRGSRDTLFVTSIDGIENRGARGPNWIFRVDDKLGDRSAGAFEVKAGQKVIWHFGKYEPDK